MISKQITVNILSPEKTVFSGEAQAVFLPGHDSPFEVLPGHAPIITVLNRGLVRVRTQGEETFQIDSGMAIVKDNVVTICVEM